MWKFVLEMFVELLMALKPALELFANDPTAIGNAIVATTLRNLTRSEQTPNTVEAEDHEDE